MNEPVLYRWPASAAFGRVIPKTKFYEHGTIKTALRERFVSDVQRITWAYKLADATIHLRGESAVPEIQVFVIDAKEDDIGDGVLAAIDRAVQFPVIFEINGSAGSGGRMRMVAAHKRLDGAKTQISTYFSTDWLPADAPRRPIPPALDLPSLYRGLLVPILPGAARPGESLQEATARVDQARKLEREIATLERRLRAEPQFNRKVELHRLLQERTATLAGLTDPAQPSTRDDLAKDAPWTS